MTTGTPARDLGALLRVWRQRRRMSQLDLAIDANVSLKQLSCVETGRSQPSLQMLLDLATCLNVPLRDKNALLSAAGFEPLFAERGFCTPELGAVRRAVESVLAAHDPNPALVIDRYWTMLSANRAVAHLVAGAEPMLLRPPVNVIRLFLHPAGLAPRILNLAQWRTGMIARLHRHTDLRDDPMVLNLLDEIRDYPSPHDNTVPNEVTDMIASPFRLATCEGVLSFFCTTTLFDAPVDITVADLSIEAFLPADPETATYMRDIARGEKAGEDKAKADTSRPSVPAQPAEAMV